MLMRLLARFISENLMFHIQALLGLVMAGIMATASAAGPGYLGNLSGQTFTIGNTFNAAAAFNDEYGFAFLPSALDYRFVVPGNVTGKSGGSAGGALQAAPVPEPDEGWMSLVSGLGLVGLKLGRFKRRMF
jgi:hypothetical protein